MHDVDEGGLLAGYRSLSDAGESPGLMHGEVGVLLVSWKLEPTPEKEERLFDLVAANARNPSHELFNGSPGTMLAALHLYEQTGDDRWRELWLACADALLEQFRTDPEYGCRLWIQYRRGRLIRSIGAGHGFASNVHSLLRGGALLGEERLAEIQGAALRDRCRRSHVATKAPSSNWPTAADPYWAADFPIRVQWCHGAPGLVTSLATLPPGDEADALLGAAGELVWQAGPLRKGAGLCHGTAGNGCAFLALHARTGDERWLDRARAFAMHALEQVERSEPTPLALDRRHRCCALSAGLPRRLGRHAGARRSLGCWSFSQTTSRSPRSSSSSSSRSRFRSAQAPLARSSASRSIARSTCPLSSWWKKLIPARTAGIEIGSGPPPEREPEAVDAVVRDRHGLGSSPCSRRPARRGREPGPGSSDRYSVR